MTHIFLCVCVGGRELNVVFDGIWKRNAVIACHMGVVQLFETAVGELIVAVIGSEIQLYETRAIGARSLTMVLGVMPTSITSMM